VHRGPDNMIEFGLLVIGIIIGFVIGAYIATLRIAKAYQDVFKSVHADLRDVHADLQALKKERESRG
jgi:uncharacterized membrane-anchored protein YhcB (DUF1043 family)